MLTSVLLGILQGLTEFLPISSSGHLVIVQSFIKTFQEPGLAFDIILHSGTLLAVLIFFWKEFAAILKETIIEFPSWTLNQSKIIVLAVLIGTFPSAVIGIFFKDHIEQLFQNPRMTSVFLCFTAAILLLGEMSSRRFKKKLDPFHDPKWSIYLYIGLCQAIALLPGISRSGSTMAAGLSVGWSRQDAAKFSFFLMVPAVLGAVILELPKLINNLQDNYTNLLALSAGFIAAFITGYLVIAVLLKYLRNHSFIPFSIYCLGAGVCTFFLNS